MLKNETLKLIDLKKPDYKEVFSICIGSSYLKQVRLGKYISKYNSWNTNIKQGILQLDDVAFDVEYIGTTSNTDNYWYSSEIEKIIPDEFVYLMLMVRE